MWKIENLSTNKIETYYSEQEYKELQKENEQQKKCIEQLEWLSKKLMRELEDMNGQV